MAGTLSRARVTTIASLPLPEWNGPAPREMAFNFNVTASSLWFSPYF